MGLSAKQRERLQEISERIGEILGGSVRADGRAITFAELRGECVEAGDLLTAAMLQQRVAKREPPEQPPCCPACGGGEGAGPDEPRVLLIDRGEVSWLEPSSLCRHCRRSLFPRSTELGLAVEDTASPRALIKMVYSGTSAASFAAAS